MLLNSKLHYLSLATLVVSLTAGVKTFNFIHFVSRISRIHENYKQRDEFINFSKSIFKTKLILENSGENTSCPCKQISWIAKNGKQISWITKREKQISWITKKRRKKFLDNKKGKNKFLGSQKRENKFLEQQKREFTSDTSQQKEEHFISCERKNQLFLKFILLGLQAEVEKHLFMSPVSYL